MSAPSCRSGSNGGSEMSFVLDVAPDLVDVLLEELRGQLDHARRIGELDALGENPEEAFGVLFSIPDPEPGSPVFVAQHSLLMMSVLKADGRLAVVDGFPGVRTFLADVLEDCAAKALCHGHYATARGLSDLLVQLMSEQADSIAAEPQPEAA